MTYNPIATLTNQQFLAKWHAGELIPIQYMNSTRFTLYCASITKTDIADIHRSFGKISQLIHIYCPTAQILPQYLQFTIESGIILLDSTIQVDGDYEDWKHLTRTPLQFATRIITDATKTINIPLTITEQTRRRLNLCFHPDKFLKYHEAYQPFVTKAQQVFVVAWNILQDDYDDVPELLPSSYSESYDDTDWKPYRPQFQATIAHSPDADDVTLICGPTKDDADLFLDVDFNLLACCPSSYDIPVHSTSCSEEVSHISLQFSSSSACSECFVCGREYSYLFHGTQ